MRLTVLSILNPFLDNATDVAAQTQRAVKYPSEAEAEDCSECRQLAPVTDTLLCMNSSIVYAFLQK